MEIKHFEIGRGPGPAEPMANENGSERSGFWVSVSVVVDSFEEAMQFGAAVLGPMPAAQARPAPVARAAAAAPAVATETAKAPVTSSLEEATANAIDALEKSKKGRGGRRKKSTKTKAKADAQPELPPLPEPGVEERAVPPVDAAEAEINAARDDITATVEVPADLAASQSFRQVMDWMLDPSKGGFAADDRDGIVAKCETLRAGVPAIANVAGDLSERVGRALVVLAAENVSA